MKHKIILLLALILSAGATLKAQTVSFYFVAPVATISANFPGAPVTSFCPTGYAQVNINAANAATFLSLAPPRIRYVYTRLQTGTDLRTNIERVFNNSGRIVDVQYILADDRNGFLAADTVSQMFSRFTDTRYARDNKVYVWPAASGDGPSGGRYRGWVMLGEHQLEFDQSRRLGGLSSIDEVVLHETSHTQFVGEWTKWGATSGGIPITYGADSNHYTYELLGDQEAALNEGLATYYGYMMNTAALNQLMTEYNDPGNRFFVEGRSVMAGQRELYTVASRTERTLTPGVIVFDYTWRAVPGWYLLFSETTSTAFYSIFWSNSYRNRDTALSMVTFASRGMFNDRRKRFLTYACNRISIRMEEYNNSAAGRADTSRLSSLFPFAVLDLLTHFGMPDSVYQRDYRINYPDREPRAYAEYFTRRNEIRQLVQADLAASPVRFQQALQAIRQYCRRPDTFF